MILEQWNFPKNKVESVLYIIYKNELKMDTQPKHKRNYKTLEENLQKNHLGFSNVFSIWHQRTDKQKIGTLDFVNICDLSIKGHHHIREDFHQDELEGHQENQHQRAPGSYTATMFVHSVGVQYWSRGRSLRI